MLHAGTKELKVLKVGAICGTLTPGYNRPNTVCDTGLKCVVAPLIDPKNHTCRPVGVHPTHNH